MGKVAPSGVGKERLKGVQVVCRESRKLKKEGRKIRLLYIKDEDRVFVEDSTVDISNYLADGRIVDCGLLDRYVSMEGAKELLAHRLSGKI